MAWLLSVEDTTEDTTAIITPKRFATRAAPIPPPQEAPGDAHRWERARAGGDTRLRAAVVDDRGTALNGTAWNTGSVQQRSREEIYENRNVRKCRMDCRQPPGGLRFVAGKRLQQRHKLAAGRNVRADFGRARRGPTIIRHR